MGRDFFPGVRGYFADPALRATLFAVPQDAADARPAATAADAAGNARWAGPYAVIVATTPDAAGVSGPSTRAWVSYATFTFVSTFANASYYRRAWTASPSHTWTESEALWNDADGPAMLVAPPLERKKEPPAAPRLAESTTLPRAPAICLPPKALESPNESADPMATMPA